ncbi:MAG: hypothetical protein K2M82_02270 [Lachnospiraceae bacterium]|nr:hypothetical protein [Lachnospiraceae bacterium]
MNIEYLYFAMWLLIAVFLIIFGIKENKIYFLFSVYFIFNAIWWFCDIMVKADLFHGIYGWIFRGITAIYLAIVIVCYLRAKKKGQNNN